MNIKVTDNSGGLDSFIEKLERLAKGGWQDPLYERIGHRLQLLVEEQWGKREDPWGTAWAPTTRENPILEESGEMRGSVYFEVLSNGVKITVDDVKAAYHQYGTKRGIRPRKMLPEGRLPEAWIAAIREETEAFFAEHMKQ